MSFLSGKVYAEVRRRHTQAGLRHTKGAMARKKLRVGVLFGGRSGEHEVSLRSARSILQAIDRKKYDVVELGITKEGRWLQSEAAQKLLAGSAQSAAKRSAETGVALAAAEPGVRTGLDVVFPVLHGTFG